MAFDLTALQERVARQKAANTVIREAVLAFVSVHSPVEDAYEIQRQIRSAIAEHYRKADQNAEDLPRGLQLRYKAMHLAKVKKAQVLFPKIPDTREPEYVIPQASLEPRVEGRVSAPCVMKTPAGWYVGTTYFDEDMDGWFPNSRDTHYVASEAEAEALLQVIIGDDLPF